MTKYKIHHQLPLFRILGIAALAGGTLFCGVSVLIFMSYDDWNVRMFRVLNTYFISVAASIFFFTLNAAFRTTLKITDDTVKIYYPLFFFRSIKISDITKLHILRYERVRFSRYRRGIDSRMRLEIYIGEKLVVLNDNASGYYDFKKIPDNEVPLRRFYDELSRLTENDLRQ